MIRRAAALVGTGQAGYILAGLVQVDSSGNETMVMIFENTLDGTISQQAITAVKFTDGSPAIIPTLP